MAPGNENRYRYGFCSICVHTVKWVPVLFLAAMIGWSYYAYVYELCFVTVESYFAKLFYLLAYHLVLFIFLWSYWQTIFTPVAPVPKKFQLPKEEREKMGNTDNEVSQSMIVEAYARTLPITNRTVGGTARFCEKCQHIKPDRAHHCSVCRMCVLKMDHHCPWVNNCVSFTNYKFFILFLGYAFLYCIYIVITTLQYFIRFLKGNLEGTAKFHILFLFFVAAMFATSLVSLFVYHCYLVAHNRTTLEAFRSPIFTNGPDKNGFSLGKYNNFQEVFGDRRWLWFLPIFSSLGDGVVYPVASHVENVDRLIEPHSNRA